ncbi:MAG TPA: type VI secretion system tip protein TssI/VgrG [Candidatus Nanopelagicales bacterium]|nr:type VI secretion system tip protein TssI/VgrG [Candidatus Nanopelagicales bacterium]
MENARLSFENAEDTLSVRSFRVEEAMSGLFRVEIRAVSPRESLDLSTFVGRRAGFALSGPPERRWRGLCESMTLARVAEDAEGLATYELVLVPALWRLTQRTGHRLFQHVSIPEIVTRILGEWGVSHSWLIATEAYPKLELRAQYGETDYSFVSRLLEEAGISFWFLDQGDDDMTLVLGDEPQANDPRPGPPIPFVDETFQAQAGEGEHVTRVRLREQSRPGRVTLREYDFWRPRAAIFASADSDREEERAHEQYHYVPGAFLHELGGPPGGSVVPTAAPVADDRGMARFRSAFGATHAQRIMEAMHADRELLTFEASMADLAPGVVIGIGGHPHDEISGGRRWLMIRNTLEGEVANPSTWRFAATSVPADRPYRPARVTPKPRIHGLQTAVVVGPGGAPTRRVGGIASAEAPPAVRLPGGVGELSAAALDAHEAAARLVDNEIYVDEHGRVRVQFPWDRENEFNAKSSIWMRVSQGWAGAGYGMFTIPRVGHEVLVAFLDGDPDNPIVVGRVHNGVEQPPFKLPENKTVSTLRTASSPGGGGFNELRFDDATGREHVYLQAQRDMDHLVKASYKESVGLDRSRYVQNDDAIGVGRDRTKFVNHNEIEATGLNRLNLVGLNRVSTVGIEDTTHVGSRWSVTMVRGLSGALTKELERVAGSVGGVMRGAASAALGMIGQDPLANRVDAALSGFGKAAFGKLRGALSLLDGFQTDPGPPPTSIEMVDRQIKLTTGEASIILDGPNVTITAQGTIAFHAMQSISVLSEEEVAIAAREKAALISATDDVIVQAAKNLHLNPHQSSGAPDPAEAIGGEMGRAPLHCHRCGERLVEGPSGAYVCPNEQALNELR